MSGTRKSKGFLVGFGAVLAGVLTTAVVDGKALAGAGMGAPSDDRATYIPGNVQPGDCQGVGTVIDEELISFTLGEFNGEANGEVTITAVDSSFTVVAIYVKGGPDTNRYVPGQLGLPASPPWEDLRPPLNEGGQNPSISHWFVCGTQSGTTTTTSAQTTTTASGETTTTGNVPTTAGQTTTSLPATGSSTGSVSAIAVLALVGGAVALVIARRRTA